MIACPEMLDAIKRLEAIEARPFEGRERVVKALPSDYEPWWAQRMMHRPESVELGPPDRAIRLTIKLANCRVVVAGRQSGKTESAVAELLRVMLERPGSYSVLLAPTYKIAQAAIRKVHERCAEDLPGMWSWKEQKKELHLNNGSIWAVFSADRKETVRGPTINGLFWVDEAALVSLGAWEAAFGALGAVQEPLILLTTTPMGKNWVHGEFTDSDNRCLRFVTEDSPYHSPYTVNKARKRMGVEKFAQEFLAVFVDNLLLVFPPDVRKRMWVSSFPKHKEAPRNSIGVDLAKHQDWTVLTLMNQWGEGVILARVQKLDYPDVTKLIAGHCEKHSARPVLDRGGAGGGPGEVIADYLKRNYGLEVLLVNTGSRGVKCKIVEQTQGDAQWDRLKLLRNEHHHQADHELARFQGLKYVQQGEKFTKYEGPALEGEFDDCVLSICLANHGRLNWEATNDPTDGDFSGFDGANSTLGATNHSEDGQFGGFGGVGGSGNPGQAFFKLRGRHDDDTSTPHRSPGGCPGPRARRQAGQATPARRRAQARRNGRTQGAAARRRARWGQYLQAVRRRPARGHQGGPGVPQEAQERDSQGGAELLGFLGPRGNGPLQALRGAARWTQGAHRRRKAPAARRVARRARAQGVARLEAAPGGVSPAQRLLHAVRV